MEAENGELIGILSGADEISSLNCQSRWSYKANEIKDGREFVSCIRRDIKTGGFVVHFDRLSATKPVKHSTHAGKEKERSSVIKKISNSAKKKRKVSFSRFLSSMLSRRKGTSVERNSLPNEKTVSFANRRVSICLNSSPRKWAAGEVLSDILAKSPSFLRQCNQQPEPPDFQRTGLSRRNTVPSRKKSLKLTPTLNI